MGDRKKIALDYLARAQADAIRASSLLTQRVQLAYEYGASEDDITGVLGRARED